MRLRIRYLGAAEAPCGGGSSAKRRDVGGPKNAYLPEKRILAKLPLLHHMLAAGETGADTITGATASAAQPAPTSPPRTPREGLSECL